MDFDQAHSLLTQHGQESILDHWNKLSAGQKENLLDQLSHFRFSRWDEQQKLLPTHTHVSPQPLLPFVNPTLSDSTNRIDIGRSQIREGKVGCMILAGGQGSRLHFGGPKGCFPITAIKQRSLFQIQAEKIAAACQFYGRSLPVAVMTSSLNDEETKQFFFEHNAFGLDPDNLYFFQQPDLPYLDEEGNLILQAPDTVAEGPDGNGSFYQSFVDTGIFGDWVEKGVRYLHVFPIDNPLIDPFDPELIGLLEERSDDIALLAIERTDPEEKVGVMVQEEGQVRVREYMELLPEQRNEREADGRLTFRCANISVFGMAMDFLLRVAEEGPLPLHKAKKRLPLYFPNDLSLPPDRIGWKFETFWFDALRLSLKTSVLLRPREDSFAPLKSVSGRDSILHVQEALENKEKRLLEAVTGLPAPEEPVELSSPFYYPTEDFKRRWKGKKVPDRTFLV